MLIKHGRQSSKVFDVLIALSILSSKAFFRRLDDT